MGYSPWDHQGSDRTERLTHTVRGRGPGGNPLSSICNTFGRAHTHTHTPHPRASLRLGPNKPPRGALQLCSGSRTRQARPKAKPEPEHEARASGTQPPPWMGPADMPARGSNASPQDLPSDLRASPGVQAVPGLLRHPHVSHGCIPSWPQVGPGPCCAPKRVRLQRQLGLRVPLVRTNTPPVLCPGQHSVSRGRWKPWVSPACPCARGQHHAAVGCVNLRSSGVYLTSLFVRFQCILISVTAQHLHSPVK